MVVLPAGIGVQVRRALYALIVMGLVAPASAWAQEGSAAETDTSTLPAIASETTAAQDAQIAERIRSIFSQIEGLGTVDVRVSAGVVTLSGAVASAELAAQANAIAARIAGVVTVQDQLSRNLDLDTNLTPALTQFREDMRGLVRGLPLLGVAIAIGGVIVFIGHLLARRERWWKWVTPNAFTAELAATSVRFVALILGLVVALKILGATALLGAVLGGAGVIGIALGFAVRDTVDNYFSSLMLSLRQPFRANDHVVIDDNEGRVIRLTSRATILMTLDGNHLRIPNATVFKSVILNYTRNPERRFQFDLGIDAGDEPIAGMKVGLEAIKTLEFVLDMPKATAVIWEVGDSNIVLRFFGWVNQERTDFLKARSLAIQKAKTSLEAAGFALPEPIYRLRFDEGVPSVPPLPVSRKPAPKVPPESSRIEATSEDVTPDAHVEKLVNEERAETVKDDLLDSQRPIE